MYIVKLPWQLFSLSSLILLSLSLVSCKSSETVTVDEPITTSSSYNYTVPAVTNDGWQSKHIDDVNIDQAQLESAISQIVDGNYINISSVQIARNGYLVVDELFRTSLDGNDAAVGNTDLNIHTMQSTTKSFVSTLIGIAIDQGYIDSVNTKFYDLFPEYNQFDNWSSRKDLLTIEHMLTMQHGFEYNEWDYPANSDFNTLHYLYRNTNDFVKGLLDLPMAIDPGTQFVYSTMASHALGGAVRSATGLSIPEFAEEVLFTPLEFGNTYWLYSPHGRAMTGCCLYISGRDMLKFGQLFLDEGEWNGNRVVSADWVRNATTKHLILDLGFSDGYGYQWWHKTFNVGTVQYDSYFAAGNGGQFIYIIPELQTVFAFTGENYGSMDMYQITQLLELHLLKAIN